MPISKKERERLARHTFSEDKREEFGSMYEVAPEIGAAAVLRSGAGLLSARPANVLLNVPEGVILSAYLYLLFGSASLARGIEYTIAFLILQFFVSSVFDAAASIGFAKGRVSGYLDAIGIAFAHLRPVAYAIASLTLFAFVKGGMLGLGAAAFYTVVVLGAVIFLIWHVINIDSSLAPFIRYLGTGAARSLAVNRSWHYLSNQSGRLLLSNAAVFLPVFILTLAYAFTQNPYVLGLDFALFVLCASLWQATMSEVYSYVKRNMGKFDYSRV